MLVPLAGCGGSGGGGGGGGSLGGQAQLRHIQFGRLVDVYGLLVTPSGSTIEPFRKDVVIGGNIVDQRPTGSTLRDDEVSYDFFGIDPDTLQPRLLIPRAIGSDQFQLAFDGLDDEVREVTPMLFGEGGPGVPYSVVPRNSAIRLVFSSPLGVDDAFFVQRNEQGQVTGLRNTEAVQLLKIVGDPNQPNAFVPMPVRVIVQDRMLVLDPVLLGTEGLQYQAQNNAAGMPASPDSFGANIRVAIALDGPLQIRSVQEGSNELTGLNNAQVLSVVRDFRSGNRDDSSIDLARGFVRDGLPLRVVGDIPMYLERVDEVNAFTQEITVFKNGLSHEIDRGDVMRISSSSASVLLGSAEVVVDPEDDFNNPTAQHVRVRIRRIDGLEAHDPSELSGYPTNITEREAWLVANAPRATCVAEFTAGGEDGRDDPNNFISFSPTPTAFNGVQPAPNEFVSTSAEAIVRFTKPVDLDTVRWADTFFFAMKNLSTNDEIEDFIANVPWTNGATSGVGMNPASFDLAKYRTPYLITSRVLDENGSQTSLRLQPTSGFYLDDGMRNPPPGVEYNYFLHLISESDDGGIRDLAGNRLDLQGETASRNNSVVIEFSVDTRVNVSIPLMPDNIAVSVVRRFASRDEDEQPSYFLPQEVQGAGQVSRAASYPLEDIFGAFVYIDNKLVPRPTTRSKVIADNLNQAAFVQSPPPTTAPPTLQNPLGACPQELVGEWYVGSNTATQVANVGIQNPLNPYGCRLQTLWREIDLSLSRTDPFDFNLDVEQMYWAPYTATTLLFDEFDSMGLILGHCEYRPIPCVGNFTAVPDLPDSGLDGVFEKNYAWNPRPTGTGANIAAESQSSRRAVYFAQSSIATIGETTTEGVPMTIDPATVVYEPNGFNRFLPLPEFKKPYFVYRDETVAEQGGNANRRYNNQAFTSQFSSDVPVTPEMHAPYVLSPFTMGQGSHWVDVTSSSTVQFVSSFWNDGANRLLTNTATPDEYTGGLMGSVALPLLADFWTIPDSSALPAGGGYVALGTNGWQTAVTVGSDSRPRFRSFSAGRPAVNGAPLPVYVSPGSSSWSDASGGFAGLSNTVTPADGSGGDNTFYWIMLDVLKRQSVITAGFVDLNNPHRVPEGYIDPRLGPFYLSNGNSTLPASVRPMFAYEFDPPLSRMPAGTSVVAQFRAAGIVDPTPWYWNAWISANTDLFPFFAGPPPFGYDPAMREQLRPTAANFPLDPFKAGDAHLRKYDTRPVAGSGTARNFWTYLYNRTVTRYVEDPNELVTDAFTSQFGNVAEPFTPRDVRYVNWRFVTGNNADANPPVSPEIETFALSYRFRQQ